MYYKTTSSNLAHIQFVTLRLYRLCINASEYDFTVYYPENSANVYILPSNDGGQKSAA